MWAALWLDGVIDHPCGVDLAGEAVLEFLLKQEKLHSPVLGLRKLDLVVAVGSWDLWWERRKLVHGEATQMPAQIAMVVRSLVANYAAAYSPKAAVKRGVWTPTPRNFVKPNVDAAFDSDTPQGAVGAVVRDGSGKFIAAADSRIKWCSDVLTTKVTAMKHGLNLAQSL